MSLAQTLARFDAGLVEAANLLTAAHRTDASAHYIFSASERQLITASALLQTFKVWEGFLEESFSKYLIGRASITGVRPRKFARPANLDKAREMLIGASTYFDYAKHGNVRKVANIYFVGGEPFETNLASILTDLSDLRTMRNAAAHISSSTQTALEALAQRLFRTPQPNIALYDMLLRVDPSSPVGDTVFAHYQKKLAVTAELIAKA